MCIGFVVWECICKRAVREPGHNEREGKKKVDMCTLDIDMTGKKQNLMERILTSGRGPQTAQGNVEWGERKLEITGGCGTRWIDDNA